VTGNADETDFARSAASRKLSELECGAAAPLLGANHPPTSRSRGTTAWQANGHPPWRVNWNEHELTRMVFRDGTFSPSSRFAELPLRTRARKNEITNQESTSQTRRGENP
jgi:hypothetical protein